jgi:hypothetical protein
MVLWRLGVVAASKSGASGPAGYYGGGVTASGPDTSNVNKMPFSTDTFKSLTSLPTTVRRRGAASSLTNNYFSTSPTEASKYSIATDVKTDIPAAFPAPSSAPSGFATGFSPTNAYFSGGFIPGPGPWGPDGGPGTNVIAKFTFSSETGSRIPQTLPTNNREQRGTSSPTHAYVFGGFTSPSTSTTLTNKIAFSTDAVSTIPAGMSVGRNAAGAWSSPTHAYVGGGDGLPNDETPQPSINKFSFADDSRSTLPITTAKKYVGMFFNSTHGYLLGGQEGYPGTTVATVQKIATTTDTSSISPTNIPTAIHWHSGTALPL